MFTAAPMGRVAVGDRAADRWYDRRPRRTVLDTVLDRLEGRGSPAHQVWLPPLTDSPTLDDLLQRAGTRAALTVPIGLVDCPFEQRRDLLVAQLAGAAGNVAVVGGPRSGKSTALQTLVLALAETHDPRDVQVYCLDFGGGSLSSLCALPHVGSVGRPTRRRPGPAHSRAAGVAAAAREARRSSGDSRPLTIRTVTCSSSSTGGLPFVRSSKPWRHRSPRSPPRGFRTAFMSSSLHRGGPRSGRR